jgi:hypothetical protein
MIATDFIKELQVVDSTFYPIIHNKNLDIDGHFKEFLDLFELHFSKDDNIGCIVPIYYELNNWNEWSKSDYRYSNCLYRIKDINERYNYQTILGDLLGAQFSKIVVDDRTEQRKNILIKLKKAICIEVKKIDNVVTEFSFPCSIHKEITDSLNFKSDECELKTGALKLESKTEESFAHGNIVKYYGSVVNDQIDDEFILQMMKPVFTHSLYISESYSLLYIFSHIVKGIRIGNSAESFNGGLGGIFILVKNNLIKTKKNLIKIVNLLESIADKLSIRIINYYYYREIFKNQLKTAIISILIDSYAHNISAHSLSALKWWIELRYKMLDARFSIPVDGNTVLNSPNLPAIKFSHTEQTTKKYYETLGLTDSTYDKGYYSLFDFLQFADLETVMSLFSFAQKVFLKKKVNNMEVVSDFFPRFPVPIDYALFPFFRFLRDKGAFWSGVTRNTSFGGESKTWFKILWEDFANNPLYLGTIAKSEGITKLNINLAVKVDDQNWEKGRFVTIDMSIILAEEELSKNLGIAPKDALFMPSKGEDNTVFSDELDSVKGKYSKYAFVKLGDEFKKFREILNKEEEYNVFLPGGIVGEHSLFTIFENTIRNIKHYKEPATIEDLRSLGINLWISIEKKYVKEEGSKPKNHREELFKVGVWLGHKVELWRDGSNIDESIIEDVLLSRVTESTGLSVLDQNGTPRMGGNSQDKICAAMLFTNEFITVETKTIPYYPWITLASSSAYDSVIDEVLDFDGSKYIDLVDTTQKTDQIQKYKEKIADNKNGYLKKYFHVWRGYDFYEINEDSRLEDENISRFKIAIIKSEEKAKVNNLYVELRQKGVVRIVMNQNIEALLKKVKREILQDNSTSQDNAEFNSEVRRRIYKELNVKWLKDWINLDRINLVLHNDAAIIRYEKGKSPIYIYGNKNVTKESEKAAKSDVFMKSLYLSHGSDQTEDHCNVRSHGMFWTKFFDHIIGKQPDNIYNNLYPAGKDHHLTELLEIVLTRVYIYDNRMWERMQRESGQKIESVYNESLSLFIYPENPEDFETHLSNDVQQNQLPLILVIHLSFIESLGYTESKITDFIDEKIPTIKSKENFLFIITSGRGRDDWRISIESGKDINQQILKRTLFKPVESLLNALESGISYNDNFDVKYNLIKVVFGS